GLPLAIGATAAKGGTLGEYLAVVLVVAARAVREAIRPGTVAARMLLIVAAAAGLLLALEARAAEFRTIFMRTFELWTILARPRKSRTLVSAAISRVALAIPVARLVVTGLVEFRPVEFALAIVTRRTLETFLA